jgi:hypothetical protein
MTFFKYTVVCEDSFTGTDDGLNLSNFEIDVLCKNLLRTIMNFHLAAEKEGEVLSICDLTHPSYGGFDLQFISGKRHEEVKRVNGKLKLCTVRFQSRIIVFRTKPP